MGCSKDLLPLYNENTLTLDVDSPLERFGGRTTVDVLKTAFQKHVSQISYSFNVMDNGYAKTYWGNFDMRASDYTVQL